MPWKLSIRDKISESECAMLRPASSVMVRCYVIRGWPPLLGIRGANHRFQRLSGGDRVLKTSPLGEAQFFDPCCTLFGNRADAHVYLENNDQGEAARRSPYAHHSFFRGHLGWAMRKTALLVVLIIGTKRIFGKRKTKIRQRKTNK